MKCYFLLVLRITNEKGASVKKNDDDIEKNLKANQNENDKGHNDEEVDIFPEMDGLWCISNSEKHK